MAKQSLEIKDFSGGLNCYSDARDIQDTEFSQFWNVTSSQKGILKIGGSLVEHIYGLPHSNTNFQAGYGLFAISIDSTPTIIDGQFESGFEEGAIAGYASGTPSITLATLPTFQSATNHATNDFYNNYSITIYKTADGALPQGETRRIIDYIGSSKIATLESAFSVAPLTNGTEFYKIYRWSGDNTAFGDSGTTTDLNYIDKGGSDFPYDDIESYNTDYPNSYFLRTKVASIADDGSSDLGFAIYNPSTSASWANSANLATNSTTIGANTLKPGIKYTLSFWAKCSAKYYQVVADTDKGDIYPFVQIYSDSVTDGTNTGLYLFQSDTETTFLSGSESAYQYAQNLTKQYVVNGDFEDGGVAGSDGGDGGRSGTYDPPKHWMAYDGWDDEDTDAIIYSHITSGEYGEGNTLDLDFGSGHEIIGSITLLDGRTTSIPSNYLYQDITLEDNQWYDLSFVYSREDNIMWPMYSIVDQNDLTSTGVYAAETEGADDSSVTLTVDNGSGGASAATNALMKYKEIYTTTGGTLKFLGVCTSVTNNTTIVFAGGTAEEITNNDVLYVANYITTWDESIGGTARTTGITSYAKYPYNQGGYVNGFPSAGGQENKFFVPNNSGTPTKIRLAFSAKGTAAGKNMRLDAISIKKSLPNLESMARKDLSNIPHPTDDNVTSWYQYKMNFMIPPEYDEATDWVINLNAGAYGHQNGSGTVDNHTVYFDEIKIETTKLNSDLIFLNDNTSTESKINVYSESTSSWIENLGLTWNGLNMKPVYTYINGMLKITDANFDSGNSSKLFYYNNLNHRVRDDELSTPPDLLVSAQGNASEVSQVFDAGKYMNIATFKDAHQCHGDITSPTVTNWPLDDLYDTGRILSYFVYDTNDIGGTNALTTEDGTTALTSIGDTTNGTGLIVNPSYYMWAGAADGSGDATDYDMQSTMSAYTSGSIAKIYFTFIYSFQGAKFNGSSSSSRNNIVTHYPPYFEISAAKRIGTDIFDAGQPTVTEQKQLSMGLGTIVDIEDSKEFEVRLLDGTAYNENSITEGGQFNEPEALWKDSELTSFNSGDGNYAIRGSKTFTSDVTFDDGDIELTDDMVMKINVKWPGGGYGTNSGALDGREVLYNLHSTDRIPPVYEKIQFTNCNVTFRATNWTVVTDGLGIEGIDKTKINFGFGSPSGANAFGWGERIFNTAISSVNIFDEESNLHINESLIGGTLSNNLISSTYSISQGQSPDVTIYVGHNIMNDEYRTKLKYYMRDTNSDIWYLQFYIDTKKIKVYSTTSNYSSYGVRDETNKNYVFTLPKEKMLSYNEVDSYESQTLVSQDLKGSELVCDYKTSVVANSRLYVGNIRQDGTHYPDRMLKSPIGKYNILPKSNFIDVAINDGDEITALEYYKDKLLQFKKRKVFIINVSGDYEFLEDTFDNIGIQAPYQVCKTPYGIAWANQSGLYIYNGENITNLIKDKIPNNSEDAIITNNYWQFSDDVDSANKPLVGYDNITKDIIVKFGLTDSITPASSPDGYIYNIDSKSWYFTHKSLNGVSINAGSANCSNFSTDSKGNLIVYNYANSSASNITHSINDIMKWKHVEGTDEDICERLGVTSTDRNRKALTFTTKDYTFGNITSRDKIYKIYITYKSEDSDGGTDSKILVKYSTNGSNSFSGTFSDSSTNYAAATGLTSSTSWTTAILKPSSSINNIYSIQLQFSFAGAATLPAPLFQINDLSIVYRPKRIK